MIVEPGKSRRPLEIRFFDVGHGDSILIQFPDRKTLGVIDCHSNSENNRIAEKHQCDCTEPKLLSYLRTLKRLNPKMEYQAAFICLTHFHDDHFSGLPSLIRGLRELNIPIKEYWDPGVSGKKVQALAKSGTRDANRQVKLLESLYALLKAELQNGLRKEHLTSPRDNFKTYGDVSLDVVAPHAQHWEDYLPSLADRKKGQRVRGSGQRTSENAISSAILLVYGQASALLTGDAPNECWRTLFKENRNRFSKIHLVKSSHHGSRQGNFLSGGSESVWQQMAQKGQTVAVISGGYKRSLPHIDTLDAINKSGAELYCTGDYRQRVDRDPLDSANLPKSVIDTIKSESVPNIDSKKPFHGDITVFLFPNGTVKVKTEFKPSA